MAGAAAALTQPYDCSTPAAASITFSLPFPRHGEFSTSNQKVTIGSQSRVTRSPLKADGVGVCGVRPSATFPDL